MATDNPAERLLAILQAGTKLDRNGSCRQAWANLLDAEPHSPALQSRLGLVMQLPALTIAELQTRKPELGDQVWQHWHSQIAAAFAQQQIDGHWKSFISLIDANSLAMLAMVSSLLELPGARRLDGDQIAELKARLDELYQEVIESDLPPDLLAYVTGALRRLRAVVDEYRLRGALPILEAVYQATGELAWNPQIRGKMGPGQSSLNCWPPPRTW